MWAFAYGLGGTCAAEPLRRDEPAGPIRASQRTIWHVALVRRADAGLASRVAALINLLDMKLKAK